MEDIEDTFLYSPYAAAIADKDDAGQREFFERFYALPQPVKDFIASPQVTEKIQSLFRSGIAPDGYELAIAKIVMFVGLGDVSPDKVAELLPKLGMAPEQAQVVAQTLAPIFAELEKNRLTKPVTPEAPEKPTTPVQNTQQPPRMPEMPPMSRPTETGPKPLAPMQKPPSRNIIDLRKQS